MILRLTFLKSAFLVSDIFFLGFGRLESILHASFFFWRPQVKDRRRERGSKVITRSHGRAGCCMLGTTGEKEEEGHLGWMGRFGQRCGVGRKKRRNGGEAISFNGPWLLALAATRSTQGRAAPFSFFHPRALRKYVLFIIWRWQKCDPYRPPPAGRNRLRPARPSPPRRRPRRPRPRPRRRRVCRPRSPRGCL